MAMIKVAAYCRVSTDKEDQNNSFESQKRYFREYIDRHPDWLLHDIYADEGITGTSTKKRVQFNRMINDAYDGKYQMIITKEVSRFSRNILDTIAYTRELKTLGIGVVFMSDGFCTLDPDSELRLSIMGSIAQEESRKTSSRVKWGQTRQMERGVVFGRSMLGYDVRDGKISIDPEGAKIVQMIFYKYGIEKKGTTTIARELMEAGYRTCADNPLWSNSHILKILKNEKYVGDLIQKKTITPDYLTHAKKYNHGEEDLIISRDHHEAIISRKLWEMVQEELKRRNRNNHVHAAHSNRYLFSGKIKCAECGANFISRVKKKKDGSSYRRWGCYTAVKEGAQKIEIHGNTIGCNVGKLIRDDLAIDILQSVIQSLPIDLRGVIKNMMPHIDAAVLSISTYDEQPSKLKKQIIRIHEKKEAAIDAFLSGILSAEELQRIKSRYDTELGSLEKRLKDTSGTMQVDTEEICDKIYRSLESIISCKVISEPYFKALLEYMIIHRDGSVEIKLNQLSAIWKFQLS